MGWGRVGSKSALCEGANLHHHWRSRTWIVRKFGVVGSLATRCPCRGGNSGVCLLLPFLLGHLENSFQKADIHTIVTLTDDALERHHQALPSSFADASQVCLLRAPFFELILRYRLPQLGLLRLRLPSSRGDQMRSSSTNPSNPPVPLASLSPKVPAKLPKPAFWACASCPRHSK